MENKRRGRPPKTFFPIRETVVEHEVCKELTIEENAPTHCLRCGQWFLINRDTAYRQQHPVDHGVYIRCPQCGFRAAAFYYFDRISRPRPRRIQTPEDARIPWQTPEG